MPRKGFPKSAAIEAKKTKTYPNSSHNIRTFTHKSMHSHHSNEAQHRDLVSIQILQGKGNLNNFIKKHNGDTKHEQHHKYLRQSKTKNAANGRKKYNSR